METDEILPKILRALRSLRFGTLEIVVHDSKVVRLERRERIRLDVDEEESQEQSEISNSL